MTTKSILVSELRGPALDWATGIANGHDVAVVGGFRIVKVSQTHWFPSSDWSQGGPIIEREGVELTLLQSGEWGGSMRLVGAVVPTPLIAAMRCYVASRLGDTVEVPEELL